MNGKIVALKPHYFIVFLALASCTQKQEIRIGPETVAQTDITAYGNINIKETFEKYYPQVRVTADSITQQDFLSQPLKQVACTIDNSLDDFYDDSFYYRQKAFVINDSLTLTIIEKQDKGSRYVYLYKGRPFEIINYTNAEVTVEADFHFFLEDRDCWQLGPNKYLLAETPSAWCGTILQFEFYQVVDFDKMQITQFIDKRLK